MNGGGLVDRLFNGLVWLYPASHRRVYGEEIVSAAVHRWRRPDATVRSRLAVVFDIAWGAFGVWHDRLRGPGGALAGGWLLDARFVVRSLWRSRGYAATAIVILACSVAAATTVFSFVRGTLLATPPYPDPEAVLVVWGSNVEDGQRRDVVSGPAYLELQRRTTTFDHIAAFHHDAAYLLVDGRPEVLDAVEANADFFPALGIQPAMGRLFGEEDRTSGAARTVVVTHSFWRNRLDSDPGVIGTTLPFEGNARTIIGVLPEGFEWLAPAPLFIPLRDDVLAADDPGRIHYNVIARMSAGVTIADAAADVARVARDFADIYRGFEGWSFHAERLHEVTVEAVRSVILALAATVSVVLLVALVNLTTLFRIRALARSAELGVRRALGAGWARVARILAMETTLLAGVGAALGLALAPLLLDRVTSIVPEWIPIPESASRVPALQAVLDPGVALAAFAVAVIGALLLTLPSLTTALRGADPRGSRGVHGTIRGTRLLVGIEIAVATALCVGASLLVRSADNLLAVDVGVEHEGLLTLYYGDVWGEDPEGRTTYYRRTVEAVEAVPGVQAAGVIDYIDFQAEDDFARIYFLDRSLQPTRDVREEWRRVDEGLFEAAGMPIVSGRGLRSDDFSDAPTVAVVNQAFAEKHWPGQSPIGALLSTHDAAYRDMQVVGVVQDVRSLGPAAPPPPMLYVPLQGNPRGTMGMYVRVAGDVIGYVPALQEAVWSVDSSQPIAGVWPMSAFVDAWVAVPRAARSLVLALAVLTLLLAAVGVFGIVAFLVRTRRSELGVRLALGASPDQLERDQMAAVLGIVVVSLAAGVAVGVGAARAAEGLLYGVPPLDPVSVVVAVLATTSAALLASYLPARRVGLIDPAEAMRAE